MVESNTKWEHTKSYISLNYLWICIIYKKHKLNVAGWAIIESGLQRKSTTYIVTGTDNVSKVHTVLVLMLSIGHLHHTQSIEWKLVFCQNGYYDIYNRGVHSVVLI